MPNTGRKPHKDSQTTGKALWIFLPILLLFVSITSFLAGTHIGRATDHRLGQMLDTIVLSPENEAVNPNRIDFSGQIFYTDGTPCANRVIELHSDPKRTTTDSEGVFHFEDVETGTHKLSMLDETGQPENQVEIQIDRLSGIRTGQVTGNAQAYQLAVSGNVISVHIRLQLDESHGMTVSPDVYTREAGADQYRDSSGNTADPVEERPVGQTEEIPESGEGLIAQENRTDQAAGQIQPISPSEQNHSSAETEAAPSAGSEASVESPEQPSETISATEGTGEIQTQPGNSGSDSGSSHETARPTTPDTPSTGPDPTEPVKPTDPTEPSKPTDPVEPSRPTDPTEPSKPTDPTEPSEPTEPVEPDQPADVQVQEKNGPVWQQNTEISLFADRTGAGEDRKLMPGSKGSYEFLVSNRNSYGIQYQLQITAPDGQLLLPLRYRLKSDDRYLCGDQDTWLTAKELSAAAVTLEPGEEKEYLLEWQWLFAGGNDVLDTKIGSAADLEYRVIVMIHAEQIT